MSSFVGFLIFIGFLIFVLMGFFILRFIKSRQLRNVLKDFTSKPNEVENLLREYMEAIKILNDRIERIEIKMEYLDDIEMAKRKNNE